MSDIRYIDSKSTLDAACEAMSRSPWLAVDTEFIRERTYYPRLALVQLATQEAIYCVDPVALTDLALLFDLLEKGSAVKVFHAAGQDVETLFHQRGALTTPVFDTQVAAALLGLGEQIGYAQLVKKLLGVTLDKSPARTDWMRRPLSDKQLSYAADDVRYLREMYPMLLDRLRDAGRLAWMDDELAHLADPSNVRPEPDTAWERVKGAGKLNRRQLNILRHLTAWRERQAMKSDKPRKWIVSDDALVNLALQQPGDKHALADVRLLNEKTARRHGDRLLAVIAKGGGEPEDLWPDLTSGRRPTSQEEALLDMLTAVVRIKADAHRLSPGQITTRSELLRLIRQETGLPLLSGWRRDIAGATVMAVLEGKLSLVCEAGAPQLR